MASVTDASAPPAPSTAPTAPVVPDTSARDVDLHVHTLTSACGYTSHRRLLEMARAAGRRVVAVTDHDSAAGAVAIREMAAQTGDDMLVLVGMELTTSDHGHVVVFGRGVEDDWGWRKHDPFPTHIPDHWAAIRAHPFRDRVVRNGHGLEVNLPPAPPERIDAVEVWNGGDILKKAPLLRADFHQLSWDYAREHGKVAVASSDGHRPIWIHSFFTRFEQPLTSLDGMVRQLRSGAVTPVARDEVDLDATKARWRRRAVVEWHESGKDWRTLAAAASYEAGEVEGLLARLQEVRGLVARGATVGEIAAETGLATDEAADFVLIVEEEAGFAAARR